MPLTARDIPFLIFKYLALPSRWGGGCGIFLFVLFWLELCEQTRGCLSGSD